MGILHRDIKPDNFLLADLPAGCSSGAFAGCGIIKLADFGLSCFYHRGVPEKEVRTTG